MTTATELRKLVDAEVADDVLTQFCTAADTITATSLSGAGVPSDLLTLIALYLAGHFYVISVEMGGLTYARAGQAEERYKTFGYDSHGFMATRFGQQACALDVSGTLLTMSKKDKVKFDVESFTGKQTYDSYTTGE